MIMYHLGPQLGVWIMQVSTFSRVLINRFHCKHSKILSAAFIINISTETILMVCNETYLSDQITCLSNNND